MRAPIDGETGELVGTLLAESTEKAKQVALRTWEPSEKRRNNITEVLAEPIAELTEYKYGVHVCEMFFPEPDDCCTSSYGAAVKAHNPYEARRLVRQTTEDEWTETFVEVLCNMDPNALL